MPCDANGCNCAVQGDTQHALCSKCVCAVAATRIVQHTATCDGKGLRQAVWDGQDKSVPGARDRNAQCWAEPLGFAMGQFAARGAGGGGGGGAGGDATVQAAAAVAVLGQAAVTQRAAKIALEGSIGTEVAPRVPAALKIKLTLGEEGVKTLMNEQVAHNLAVVEGELDRNSKGMLLSLASNLKASLTAEEKISVEGVVIPAAAGLTNELSRKVYWSAAYAFFWAENAGLSQSLISVEEAKGWIAAGGGGTKLAERMMEANSLHRMIAKPVNSKGGESQREGSLIVKKESPRFSGKCSRCGKRGHKAFQCSRPSGERGKAEKARTDSEEGGAGKKSSPRST